MATASQSLAFQAKLLGQAAEAFGLEARRSDAGQGTPLTTILDALQRNT